VNVAGRDMLAACRGEIHLALGASIPFARTSCGFVGASDGWTDLRRHLRMTWEFERALDGNVAVMGEIDLSVSRTFTLGLAFGFGRHAATTILLQSLGIPYQEQRARFQDLPGSPDRVAQHPLGGSLRRRGRPGWLPPRLDARHVQQRDGTARVGVCQDP
jgi:glucoamylase